MKTYTAKVKLRIGIYTFLLIAMTAYMVVIVELGGGDSRIMTSFAKSMSRIIFFGGFGWAVYRLIYNRSLLKNYQKQKNRWIAEQDERRQWLYDKSGGIAVDIILFVLMAATFTTALFNMPAFYTAVFLLLTMVLVKLACFFYYDRFYRYNEKKNP